MFHNSQELKRFSNEQKQEETNFIHSTIIFYNLLCVKNYAMNLTYIILFIYIAILS